MQELNQKVLDYIESVLGLSEVFEDLVREDFIRKSKIAEDFLRMASRQELTEFLRNRNLDISDFTDEE